jgi:hypothetical protein
MNQHTQSLKMDSWLVSAGREREKGAVTRCVTALGKNIRTEIC